VRARLARAQHQGHPPPAAIVAGAGNVADNSDIRAPVRGGLPPRAFRRVREYVLDHLADDISNPVLAELAGLSVCYFVRTFKQSAGGPPHRFALQSRVERVKHLLLETELPLAQIAVTAGFTDQSHCTRWFREIVGTTPRRFRWWRR